MAPSIQALADLPPGGVGLVFACFQSSIIKQFAFIQKRWANAVLFKIKGDNHNQTGIDGIIGQRQSPLPQHWRKEYGGTIEPTPGSLDDLHLAVSHPQAGAIGGYVRFRGGEFFFAPSLTFLLQEE